MKGKQVNQCCKKGNQKVRKKLMLRVPGGIFVFFKHFGASGPHGVPTSNVDPRWLHFASFLNPFLPSWTTIWLRTRSHFEIENFLQDSITCRICKGKDTILGKLCCHKIRGGGFARMRSWVTARRTKTRQLWIYSHNIYYYYYYYYICCFFTTPLLPRTNSDAATSPSAHTC